MTSRSALSSLGAKLGLPDLALGLDACIEILGLGKETKTVGTFRRWAMALIRYVSEAPDVIMQMSRAKSYFACCREAAIRGKVVGGWKGPPVPTVFGQDAAARRVLLHQVSRVSRTLRTATAPVVLDSLKEHLRRAQTPFETPLDIRERFRLFVRSRFGSTVEGSFSGVGQASSFASKASEGGAPDEIREITNRFRERKVSLLEVEEICRRLPSFIKGLVTEVAGPIIGRSNACWKRKRRGTLAKWPADTIFFPFDKKSGLSLMDWEAAREQLFALTACWLEIDMDTLPSCRQVSILERGFKVRIATPLEAPFRFLLGFINSGLLAVLEGVPQVVSALHGCPAEKLDWSEGRRYNLVFSADLKSATDLLPMDLMRDAAEVLSENWCEGSRRLLMRAVGPHTLHPAKGLGEPVTTSRGILMGSPVSWPLLSIYSAFLHSESGSDGWYAVCGDDYLGCHTYATYRRYLAIRDATGAEGSPGKDILGTRSVGCFAEELITLGRKRWIPTVSVRAVLGDPKSGVPAWTQGPQVTEALARLRLPDTDTARISAKLHATSISILRRNGIDPSGPRWCGGAGFPGFPTQQTLTRARRMTSQSQKQVTKWIACYEGAWSFSSGSEQLANDVAEDIHRNREYQRETDVPGDWGPMRDIVLSRMSTLSWVYFLAGAVKRELRVSIRSVKQRLTSVNEAIAQAGYWLPSDIKVVSGSGIIRRLNELEPMGRPIPFSSLIRSIELPGSSSSSYVTGKKRTGPGTPSWGAPRKRPKLSVI
jgi:hypothetical protein